jgi:hypothetical protein
MRALLASPLQGQLRSDGMTILTSVHIRGELWQQDFFRLHMEAEGFTQT